MKNLTSMGIPDLPVECRSCFLRCVGKCGSITDQQAEALLWKLFNVAMFPPPITDKPKPQAIQQSLDLISR
jgi:hypothetical protein